MKIKNVLSVVSLIVVSVISCYPQNQTIDEQLQKKYWDYRQRFQKHFIAYSPVNNSINGSGIVINHLNTFSEGGTQNLTNSDIPNYVDATRRGIIKEADAPEQLALFFATLALEYRLLKDEGKDTKSVLNEIYYGIQALNRLDDKAEDFLSGGSIGYQRNGFLMRSDADNQLVEHFNNQYSATDDKKDNIKSIRNDYWDLESNTVKSDKKQNTMSKDHVMDILEGFSFLKKFVDNELIQPTSQEPGIQLHDEIKNITNRMLTYVTSIRQTTQTELPNIKIKKKGICTDNELQYYTNWLIFDEINQKPVYRGNNFNLFAYPIALTAKKITNYPWDSHPIKLRIDGKLCSEWYYTALDVNLNLNSSSELIPSVWHGLENQFTDLYTAMSNTIHTEVCVDIPPIIQLTGIIPNNQVCLRPQEVDDAINGFITKTDPVQLLLTLATISNTWSHGNIVAAGDSRFFYHYDLMYSLLNDDTPIHPKQFFEDILNSAPCQGPYNFNYPNTENGEPTWDPIWHHNNRWVHPTDPTDLFQTISLDREEQGYFHGLDYMFLYNMYRYYFRNEISLKYSENNSCLCNEKGKIFNNTDNTTHTILNNNITISRKFDNYRAINIFTKEYLSHNLTISNSKILTNSTDLIICNDAIVTVENGGVLRNNSSNVQDSVKIIGRPNTFININNNGLLEIKENTKVIIQKSAGITVNGINSKIIVRNGAELIIQPGAFLQLQNNSKLIVEEGGRVIIKTKIGSGGNSSENAVLTYYPGAEIQLKGDNAVLELNGQLNIMDNATFTFTYPGTNSGYILFNRGPGVWWDNWAPNNAHITCGANAKINLVGKNKTDKIVEINQINVAIPKNLAQFIINKGLVQFDCVDARLETDRTTVFTNSTFQNRIYNGPFGGPGGNARGVLMFGQKNFFVTNCDFNNTLLQGALFYGGNKLKNVKNCNFNGQSSAIYTYGSGIDISTNNFNDAELQCWDAVNNSSIYNNIFLKSEPPTEFFMGNAIFVMGQNVEFDIHNNTINNYDIGINAANTNAKLKCNDLQNNYFALVPNFNSKINMSDELGGGYNNAANSSQFAWFIESNSFEATNGYNNFSINNNEPCVYVIDNHPPYTTPPHIECPIISAGSLVNFTGYDSDNSRWELLAEQNFWKPISTSSTSFEREYNLIRKIDATDPFNPIYDTAVIITGNSLTNPEINCPNGNGNGGNAPHFRIHPLDDNSISANITTASFYNKKLRDALKISMNKMKNATNPNKINEAADLFTEILKYNYTVPVKNYVDKYLLELAYQKLFICVAQLTELHKDTATSFLPFPNSLQNRINDLHTICALRVGRKDITERDYKEISHLILLDKAMIYRLVEDWNLAINYVANIISNNPKVNHLNNYRNIHCLWTNEYEAIKGNLTFDKAIANIKECSKLYDFLPQTTKVSTARKNKNIKSEIEYAIREKIAVYPNPTNSNLFISYNLENYSTASFEIFDIQAKKVCSYNLDTKQKITSIDNLNLSNGTYYYKILADGENVMTKKLVIIK